MLLDVTNNNLLYFLFMIGLSAGIVDAIAGGGGLITLPALLGIGMPPQLALGTNKFQAFFGTFSATLSYYRKKIYSLRLIRKGLLPTFIGALLGAIASQSLSTIFLSQVMPVLLSCILIYVVLTPRFGIKDTSAKLNESLFYYMGGLLLGFYDGFIGPGVGSLWVFALSYFLGYNFLKSSAYTKVFNLASNVIATGCFIYGHNINYKIALLMSLGQFIGGKLGAKIALKNGLKVIRPIFIAVSAGAISVLFYRNKSSKDLELTTTTLLMGTLIAIKSFFYLLKNKKMMNR